MWKKERKKEEIKRENDSFIQERKKERKILGERKKERKKRLKEKRII